MSVWKDRNVFVTGGTGFIGGWLVELLLKEGANVVGLVRDRVPRARIVRERVLDRITVVTGAVEDYDLLERALAEYEVDTVFHLAAQTIVATANRLPKPTLETNVRGSWNVFEACRRVDTVKRVVFASSDKAYGSHETLPYSEDAPLQGRHPYDVSKSTADLIAKAYAETYGLPVAITRCGNVYGPGDLNFSRIVPGTIRSALRGERPVIRSDGTPVRDYIHVEDVARAYVLLAEAMARGTSFAGEAFNLSCEQPLSVIEIARRVLEACGATHLTPDVEGTARHEIQEQYLDSAKARRVVGWEPLVELSAGLRGTVEWYRAFLATDDGKRFASGKGVVLEA